MIHFSPEGIILSAEIKAGFQHHEAKYHEMSLSLNALDHIHQGVKNLRPKDLRVTIVDLKIPLDGGRHLPGGRSQLDLQRHRRQHAG